MVDTVTACIESFEVTNSAAFGKETGERDGYFTKDILYQNLPHLRLQVNNLSKELYFRASLPHLVYGASLYEMKESDIGRTVEILKDTFKEAGIKTTETALSQARVHRIDFCKNMTVDHSCKDYVALLDNFRMPKRDKINYALETLTFGQHSKNRQICIYNKVRQVSKVRDIKERALVFGMPENILRFESRLLNNKTIKKELKSSLCLYSAFNQELSKEQLLRDFNRIKDVEETQLSLNFNDTAELLRQLVSMYGNRAFEAFLGVKGSAEAILESLCFQYKAVFELFKSAGLSQSTAYKNADKLFEYHSLKPLAENRGLINELREKLAA
jgi:hypothetical protein